MIVREYNHDNDNVIEACGFDDDINDYVQSMDNITELLTKAHPRILALYLVNAMPIVNKPLHYISSSSKFRKTQVFKIPKAIHSELQSKIRENIEDLPDQMNKNILLHEFAAWHYNMLHAISMFYNKKSKTVEFIEVNYSKEEIMLLVAAAQRGKAEAEFSQMAESLIKENEGLDEDMLKQIIKQAIKSAKEDTISIKYRGPMPSEEELGIVYSDDVINREIDQNMPRKEWADSGKIFHVYGISEKIIDELEGSTIIDGINTIFTNDFTNIEKAAIVDLVISNKMRSLDKESDLKDIHIYYKLWIELIFNKNDWRHQLVLHDRISRVQWFLKNNGTKDDLMYILDTVI